MSAIRQAVTLIVLVAICLGAGATGSWSTSSSITTWYPTLLKPSWTPPAWVFAPIWIGLYLAMAVAAWLVLQGARIRVGTSAPALFALQLILNAAWSGIFFGLRLPGLAFAEIVLLWLAILATSLAFWRISRAAGWLMLVYLAWVTFAAALNLAIWQLNT